MIGLKLYKGKFTDEEYTATAKWCNENNAYISDEHAFDDEEPYYEVVSAEMTPEELIQQEILDCKRQLEESDYKCLKYVDGALSEEEYAEVKAERQALRNRINELEESLCQ